MLEFINDKRKEKKKSVVIFVHGFKGNIDTWTNKSINKDFPSLLKENQEINDNFDFAYFNYYTKLCNNTSVSIVKKLFKHTKKKKNVDIYKIANELKSAIRFKCKEYENIVIVAHSMGGLVAKALLLDDNNEEQLSKIKLFLSLAVPHSGSDWARLGKVVSKHNPQLINLEPLGDTVTELSHKWIEKEHPETVYFVGNYDDIVCENSAIAFQTGYKDIVHTDDDHLTISKPESKESLIYSAVETYLLTLLKNFKVKSNLELQIFEDNGEYDEEEFVIKLILADIHNTLINGVKQNFFNAEHMVRCLDTEQLQSLNELYAKIKHLYNIYFGKYLSGKYKDSNEFLSEIHEAIRNDDKLDISSEKYVNLFCNINHIHKTGMLHQLSNRDRDIVWKNEREVK